MVVMLVVGLWCIVWFGLVCYELMCGVVVLYVLIIVIVYELLFVWFDVLCYVMLVFNNWVLYWIVLFVMLCDWLYVELCLLILCCSVFVWFGFLVVYFGYMFVCGVVEDWYFYLFVDLWLYGYLFVVI